MENAPSRGNRRRKQMCAQILCWDAIRVAIGVAETLSLVAEFLRANSSREKELQNRQHSGYSIVLSGDAS